MREQAKVSLYLDGIKFSEEIDIDRRRQEIMLRGQVFPPVSNFAEVQADYSNIFRVETAKIELGDRECKVKWVAHQALKFFEEDQLGHFMLLNSIQKWSNIKKERSEIK